MAEKEKTETTPTKKPDQSKKPDQKKPDQKKAPEVKPKTKPVVKDAEVLEVTPKPVATPDQPVEPRSGFLPLAVGGFVAAALGFSAAQFLGNDRWPFAKDTSKLDGLTATIETQNDQLSAMKEQIATLSEKAANPLLDPRIETILGVQTQTSGKVGAISDDFAAFGQRLGDLENRPIPDIGATTDAVAAYERQLAGMREMFQGELIRIESAQVDAVKIEQSAAKRAESAAERASMARLQAALESGAPFGAALQGLRDSGIVVPAEIADFADDGLITLVKLQQEFPAAARFALNAAIRADADSGKTSKLDAFFKTQLGTRSLQPKDGDDPDAILSRSEGALRSGHLGLAMSELDALSDAAKVHMADWIALARAREAALTAVATLAETQNN